MKAFTGAVLAMLAPIVAGDALAQEPPVSKSPAIENVIVTAPRLRTENALDNFVIAHAKPTASIGKIARWDTGICPLTVGLPQNFGLYITHRIIQLAMAAGAPLSRDEPCTPNVVVFATNQPQALMDFIRMERPGMLDPYRSAAEQAITMTLPIQAWYSTATQDFYGFRYADVPGFDITRQMPGAGMMPGGRHVSGYRYQGNEAGGLKSQFTTAIIGVDINKIAGQEIGPVGDYIAMLALSQGGSYESCQDIPTITNLFAANCSSDLKPAKLTDIDMTYLRGLYRMDAGSSFRGERASIEFEMKKDLGGY